MQEIAPKRNLLQHQIFYRSGFYASPWKDYVLSVCDLEIAKVVASNAFLTKYV